MVIKHFKSVVNANRTIKLPDDFDIEEGTEVDVILLEDKEDISTHEIAKYLEEVKSFDFLKAKGEDIYTKDDANEIPNIMKKGEIAKGIG